MACVQVSPRFKLLKLRTHFQKLCNTNLRVMIVHLPLTASYSNFYPAFRSRNLVAVIGHSFQLLFLYAAASPKAHIDRTGMSPVAVAQYHLSYWIKLLTSSKILSTFNNTKIKLTATLDRPAVMTTNHWHPS
jgi:hypothetical protein